MKACETVIVTLLIGRDELDLELPAFLPVGELSEKIRETLRSLDPNRYGRLGPLTLVSGGSVLPADSTLAGCGIWDGSTITAR